MSRSGYADDIDDVLAFGRWRGMVASSIKGKRGQNLLKDLLVALDEMPDKKLHSGSFKTEAGEFCTLGVLGNKRGVKMDDLVYRDSDYCGYYSNFCDTKLVGERFGISAPMAAEIMYMNDEWNDDCSPELRWQKMRDWIVKNIKEEK